MSTNAEALKKQGNDYFKKGYLQKAAELYTEAEQADQNDPVYPSNLSAALYEAGDYSSCLEAILRSWALLRKNKSSTKPELVAKLSNRLGKALCHGIRARTLSLDVLTTNGPNIKSLRDAVTGKNPDGVADEEVAHTWGEWTQMGRELVDYAESGDESLRQFSRLPMFFKPLDHTKEFFSIGTDDIIDLTEGWGPGERYPLNIEKLPADLLRNISLMFGGVGDGRHALGTIAGLFQTYKRLPKARRIKLNAHLTLLDIHDGTIARNLCVFLLLDELNNVVSSTARSEIKATLMYTFCGAVMPPYCYKRLQAVIHSLRSRLAASPPDLPEWLHVVSESIPAILPTLDFWIETKKSTARTLEGHDHMSPGDLPEMQAMSTLPGSNADFKRKLDEKVANDRAQIEGILRGLSSEELSMLPFFPKGTPMKDRKAYVEANMASLVDAALQVGRAGKVPSYEEVWYQGTKVFLPPHEFLDRHPGFEVMWKQTQSLTMTPSALQRKVLREIENEWKPNITLFDTKFNDPNVYSDGDGYPDMKLNMFQTVTYMNQFNQRNESNAKEQSSTNENMLAAQTCGTFFEEAAAAIKGLVGHLTVEMICGGLSEELVKMRFGADTTRPEHFPRKYTRMWLSNVPDYTNGPLNMIVYALPQLQDDPQAAVACNSMLNTMVWGGDDEFFHTYTLLLPKEIPRYLGVRVINSRIVMDIGVFGSMSLPRPLSELASREELATWLTRVLFNTFIPGHSKARPHNIRCPHNLTAFFALLLYLPRVGYPIHWLSEFITRVLSGSMVSNIPPYDDFWPIPVKERLRRVQSRRVRTDPWLVDFENIIATAYYGLPFPIAAALPPDFSRDPDDIQVWEVNVQAAQYFSTQPFMNFNYPYDPRTQLLFYQPTAGPAAKVIEGMVDIFEGKRGPAPGTFFVLTMQEYVQYQTRIRFKLSRKRVERMRGEKWFMIAYRPDTFQQATRPVPIERWTPVASE
ncbi:hypothetical protein C8Q78DRAFT_971550 [Trametes maxima]|nr:hypothetical protein C8Q78DRAFT_971550 [Trametes maxima]